MPRFRYIVFRLQPLKCGRADQRSVHGTSNWRVVFRFEGGELVDMNLIDSTGRNGELTMNGIAGDRIGPMLNPPHRGELVLEGIDDVGCNVTEKAARRTRDPVAKAEPPPRAKRKKSRGRTGEGEPLHNLGTLLADLATRCRNTCRMAADPDAPALTLVTQPTTQQRAAQLIETFPVPGTA